MSQCFRFVCVILVASIALLINVSYGHASSEDTEVALEISAKKSECSVSSSSSTGSSGATIGTIYAATTTDGCTGKGKCFVEPWGMSLQKDTGFIWREIDGGTGGSASLYVTVASASGTRSMSLWVNMNQIGVVTSNKKTSRRPQGSEFGPFTVDLIAGTENTVELRDTESSKELDAISIRVVAITAELDSDNDGVTDEIDQCPHTASGVEVDSNGCAIVFADTDGDGLIDNLDLCVDVQGSQVTRGCPATFGDSDNDSVPDYADRCEFTSPDEAVDGDGCSAAEMSQDTDADGVLDAFDACSNTLTSDGEVESKGCSANQLADDDHDGVINARDLCRAEFGFARLNGCPLEKGLGDSDKDGVSDTSDECPATPPEWASIFPLEANGCIFGDPTIIFEDSDRDGVAGLLDNCPDTVDNASVDYSGCSVVQLDLDLDGVHNPQDICPNTLRFSVVDINGCADNQTPDSDGDGVPDPEDLCPFTPSGLPPDGDGCPVDADFDGLTNEEERALGTDPFNADSDADNLNDGDEVQFFGSNPLMYDTDGGGAGDGIEVNFGFNPLDPADDLLIDSDFDGLTDATEAELGTDPLNYDSDFDQLSDGSEVDIFGTNPLLSDTDGGGAYDGAEINVGLDPLDPSDDQLIDSDFDGLSDLDEIALGTNLFYSDSDFDNLADGDEVKVFFTNPLLFDTDGGGVNDGQETQQGLNPLDPNDDQLVDSDNDGIIDLEETVLGTNPFNSDSDFDGLSDGDEINVYGTDPQQIDTDGGSNSDGQEINQGTDPLDASDDLLQFPLVLQDGLGFLWDIQSEGSINDGTSDAFDGGFNLFIDNQSLYFDQATANADKREVMLTATSVLNLAVTRRVLVPRDIGAARFIDSFTNTGDQFVNLIVSRSTDLGSDGGTQILATSSGDGIFNNQDSFIISDDGDGSASGDPVITHVIQGANSEQLSLRPSSVMSSGDDIQSIYRISLRPGETVSLIALGLQRDSLVESEIDVAQLLQVDHSIWQGLTPIEVLNIGNFFTQVDSDEDGLLDGQEILLGTDPANPDSDADGLSDLESVLLAFNAELANDSDADGIVDFLDRCLHEGDAEVDATGCLISQTTDTDADGVVDSLDFCPSTPPATAVESDGCPSLDSDFDGLSDAEEIALGTNPFHYDSDLDHLSDRDEVKTFNTNPLLSDTDGGGVSDGQEISRGLNPLDSADDAFVDSDGDGLFDSVEITLGTDPFNYDSDFDGLNDGEEAQTLNTNPLSSDTDGGGVNDGQEVNQGFNPLDPSDDNQFDSDYDGLTNAEESELGTDPLNWDSDFDNLSDRDEVQTYQTNPLLSDTDGGGVSDWQEVIGGLNPLDPLDDLLIDSDSDGLSDQEEIALGTNPYYYDSDFDVLSDGDEVQTYQTNPLLSDTDGGGVSDWQEVSGGLNPLDPLDDLSFDSDSDGLSDQDEIALGTNPYHYDSDADGLSDGDEVRVFLTNALLFDTDGGGVNDGQETQQGLDPLNPDDDQLVDSDFDGLSDAEEVALGTNSYYPDSDFDGLYDGAEVNLHGTDPLLTDTDGGSNSDGQEINQGTDPLNPEDDLLQFPLVLNDGAGFIWDINTDGTISDGTNDAFDGAFSLSIDNLPPYFDQVSSSADKREVTIKATHYTNLTVTRRIWVPSAIGAARFIDSFANTGDEIINIVVARSSGLGSDGSTQILASGSGDTVFDGQDSFLISDDGDGSFSGDPIVTHVIQGENSEQFLLRTSSADLNGDNLQSTYRITLRPGETVSLIALGLQRNSLVESQIDVDQMLHLDHPIWQGLTPVEVLNIANLFVLVDSDEDGLLNGQETLLGTDPNNADSDSDGRNDRESVLIDFDPELANDSDFDGIPDFLDLCRQIGDIDVDATGCLIIADGDSDSDGVPDAIDFCPLTPSEIPVDEVGCPAVAEWSVLGGDLDS